MRKVTINRQDRQSARWCEQCGCAPTTITVIRWAEPTDERSFPVPQQAHYFCSAHQSAASRMWRELVDTARYPGTVATDAKRSLNRLRSSDALAHALW